MKRWSKVVAMAAVTSGLLGSGFFASPAYAGQDGQQVNLCGYPSSVSSARLSGTDQNGSATVTKYFNPGLRQCFEDLPGSWWKGSVKIDWTGDGNRLIKSTTCDVPQHQDGDWFGGHY